MGIVDRIEQQLAGGVQRAWPVGAGVVEPYEQAHGHDDSLFSPEEYGDYLVTSNEVYAAVSLRARLASSVPLRTYVGRNVDKREVDGEAAKLLRYVNPFWTDVRLARMDELSMGVWGETYWAIEKSPLGVPKEIWWMKAPRVTPVPHPDKYLAGFWYEPTIGHERIWFDADEVVWQRYPNPLDEFSALSPIAAARLAADSASAMMKSNMALHREGLQIAGVIAPKGDKTFSPEQARKLEGDLHRRFGGADRAHRWAVLRYEAQFQPANITPKDAEYLGGLGATARMVYNAYGVSSALLNDLQHATLANLRELQTGLWEHALVPDLELRAADIREQYLPMFKGGRGRRVAIADHVEFDVSGVPALQKSRSEAWDRDKGAIEVGGMTINEWRKGKGLPPVPWGDVWWAPVNKAAVTDADSKPQGDTSATTLPDDEGQAPADDEGQAPAKAPAKAKTKAKAEVVPEADARALLAAFDPPESE